MATTWNYDGGTNLSVTIDDAVIGQWYIFWSFDYDGTWDHHQATATTEVFTISDIGIPCAGTTFSTGLSFATAGGYSVPLTETVATNVFLEGTASVVGQTYPWTSWSYDGALDISVTFDAIAGVIYYLAAFPSSTYEYASGGPYPGGSSQTLSVTKSASDPGKEFPAFLGNNNTGYDYSTRLFVVGTADAGNPGNPTGAFPPAPSCPQISSFSPDTGCPGDTVVILGSGFTGATAVDIGGVPAASFVVDNDGQITAVVGTGSTDGSVDVTGPGGIGSLGGWTSNAPVNDNYPSSNPQFGTYYDLGSISGGCRDGTTLCASAEAGEPDPAPGFPAVHSVWYWWQATHTGTFRFSVTSTDPSMADGIMSAYNWVAGAVSGLGAAIAQGDDQVGTQPQFDVAVTCGNNYAFQIDTRNSGGTFTLNWVEVTTPPVNDNFVNAIVETGNGWVANGTTVGATAECNEPPLQFGSFFGPYNSVWYKWVAPATQYCQYQLSVGSYMYAELWQGTTLSGLSPISAVQVTGNAFFTATAGQTYYFRVTSKGPIFGSCTNGYTTFTLIFGSGICTPPPNDKFVNATVLPVAAITSVSVNMCGATIESGEPNPGNKFHSVWWKFNLGNDGEAAVTNLTGPGDTVVRLYKGTSIGTLAFVNTFVNNPPNSFNVLLGGGVYYVQATTNADSPNIAFTITIKQISKTMPAAITSSAVGSYTRIDAFPVGPVGGLITSGPWIRLVLRRISGDFVYHPSETQELRLVRRANASGGDLGGISLMGDIAGRNRIHVIGSGGAGGNISSFQLAEMSDDDVCLIEIGPGAVYIDGVYVGDAGGSSTTRYVDIGMITGPASLSGWQLTFSDIVITDDRRHSYIGAVQDSCRDLEYFTGFSDGDLQDNGYAFYSGLHTYGANDAITLTAGTYQTPTVEAPDGAYPTGGMVIDCSLAAQGTKGVGITWSGGQGAAEQGVAGGTFRFKFTAWPDVEMVLATLECLVPGFIAFGAIGIVSVDSSGRLRSTGDIKYHYTSNSYGMGTILTQLNLDQWYTCQIASDLRNINRDAYAPSWVVGIDGLGVGVQTLGSFAGAPRIFNVGALPYPVVGGDHTGVGASSVGLKIGAIATTHGWRSWPMDGPFIGKVEVTSAATHDIPALNRTDLLTTFDCDHQLIYQGSGTDTSAGTWTGAWGIYNGQAAGAVFGRDVPLSFISDPGPTCINISGAATMHATTLAPDYQNAIADTTLHPLPKGMSMFISFWVRGDPGRYVRLIGPGNDSGDFFLTDYDSTCDGTWQHVYGYSDVNDGFGAVTGPPPPNWANWGFLLDGGAGYVDIKDFRAVVFAKVLPVYALTSDNGTTISLMDAADSSSASALIDNNDNTQVFLDRQYVFDWLTRGMETQDPETATEGRSAHLEYRLGNADIAKTHAARLLVRAGGYSAFDNASFPSSTSRFGIKSTYSGAGRRLGQVTSGAIAPREVVMPAPADPSEGWVPWETVLLRMGFMDGFATNLYGLTSSGEGHGGKNVGGGRVARAFFEICHVEARYGPVSFSHIRSNVTRGPLSIR